MIHMTAFGVSVLVLLWFIYSSTAGFMERQTDETINAEIQGLAEQYSQLGLTGLIRVIKSRVARDKAGQSVYLLTDWKFNPLAGNLGEWPKFRDTGSGWSDATLEDTENFEPRRVRMRYFLLPGNFHLVVGRDVSERVKVERLIIDALVWGLALTLVLGGPRRRPHQPLDAQAHRRHQPGQPANHERRPVPPHPQPGHRRRSSTAWPKT